jgi:glucokinase
MEKCFVGIDVGKTNMRVAVAGTQPELKYFAKRAYRRGAPVEIDEQIRRAVDEALAQACVPVSCLAGIGMGVPAIVNRNDGTILFGPDYDFLQGHSITRALQERYRVPIVADVDTVVASWGEQWAGIGCTCRRFALITWGTSLGAGLILDGKVYEGPDNLFAEFGHCIVSDDDWPCICGARGCVAQLVSGLGITEHARRALLDGKDTILRELAGTHPGAVTSPMVFEAAGRGDSVALQILERVGVLLGRLCANLVYTIQPEKIVIVGGLAEQAQSILETMNKTMRDHCWLIFKGFTRCEIVSSTLGDTAGVLGSIRMVQLKAAAISQEDSRAIGS